MCSGHIINRYESDKEFDRNINVQPGQTRSKQSVFGDWLNYWVEPG